MGRIMQHLMTALFALINAQFDAYLEVTYTVTQQDIPAICESDCTKDSYWLVIDGGCVGDGCDPFKMKLLGT